MNNQTKQNQSQKPSKNREPHIRSSLQRMAAVTPMDEAELKKAAARLWHETGTVMIKPEWVWSALDRQHVENMAVMLFGKRRVKPEEKGDESCE